MSYNLNEIFKFVSADEDKVIIEVIADSPLKVAMFPFVSSEYNYITITRGRDHVLTVIKKDGKTFSFDFGDSGHTLISDSLKELKKYVLKFIEDNNVLIEWNGQGISNVKIFYNRNRRPIVIQGFPICTSKTRFISPNPTHPNTRYEMIVQDISFPK